MSTSPVRITSRASVWSALQSLETLDPPPSYPSLDNLASYPTSGDIPITFDVGISPPTSSDQISSLGRLSGLPPSYSASSDGTTCTFGPVQDNVRRSTAIQHVSCEQSSTSRLTNTHARSIRRASSPPQYHQQYCSLAPSPLSVRPNTVFCNTTGATGDLRLQDGAARAGGRRHSFQPEHATANIEVLLMGPSITMSTLPSPVFAPPSAAFTDLSLGDSSPGESYFPHRAPVIATEISSPRTPNRAIKDRLRKAVSMGRTLVSHPPPLQVSSQARLPFFLCYHQG
jgi:hypothetical protein